LPYAEGDAELFAVLSDFETTYSQYAEFQSRMEHYWCLRWLIQEKLGEATATVLRDNLVRFDALPLYVRVADLPVSAGPRVRLALGRIDLYAATIEVRYAGVAPG
jgi:exoribonuclease-2